MTFLARHHLRAIINRSAVARLLASFGHAVGAGSNDNQPMSAGL